MDRQAATTEIQRIFQAYRSAQTKDAKILQALADGKLYELFVLAKVIDNLAATGFTLSFKPAGAALKFKASPGKIKTTDPHFEVSVGRGGGVDFWIFVDIEFSTLGQSMKNTTDNSSRHEIDIVVVSTNSGYPTYNEIALGVECKAVANFGKSILKEALGVRREMGVLSTLPQPSILSAAIGSNRTFVPMTPASEFWLAFTDSKGTNYAHSPTAFGIELKHIEP